MRRVYDPCNQDLFQEQDISLKLSGRIRQAAAWPMLSLMTRKKSTLLLDTNQEEITKANMENKFFHSNEDFHLIKNLKKF